MDPVEIISRHYDTDTPLYRVLMNHSRQVADKALTIARGLDHLNPDLAFIETAAMLHDIGIVQTNSPAIGCHGEHPYICHGYLGREMLDKEGLDPAFGLVAERHTGAGITLDNILSQGLPLPKREMVPVTLEEKIICCADKFFSKSPAYQDRVMTPDTIAMELAKIDPGHADRFRFWAGEFNL